MRDIAFLSEDEGQARVPFTVTGECSGTELLLQKTIMVSLEPGGFLRDTSPGMGWFYAGIPAVSSDEQAMNMMSVTAKNVRDVLREQAPGNAEDSEIPADIRAVSAVVGADKIGATFEVTAIDGSNAEVSATVRG